ncbi:MAG: preprotein translocase subunit SecG [Filomicrobium sp.]
METVLLVVHIMIVIALIVVVLMQRSEGGALGMGGGGSGGGGFLTGRGTANLLTRTTAILAVCFFATSILSTMLAKRQDTGGSLFDTSAPAQPGQSGSSGSGEATPSTGGGGILDDLQRGGQAPISVPGGR